MKHELDTIETLRTLCVKRGARREAEDIICKRGHDEDNLAVIRSLIDVLADTFA